MCGRDAALAVMLVLVQLSVGVLGTGLAANALGFVSAGALAKLVGLSLAVAIAGLAAAVIRFRVGVEHGVIVTNVSQLDEKLESEIRGMKMGQLSSPRSVGALNTAIGDNAEESAPSKPMSAPATETPTGRPI